MLLYLHGFASGPGSTKAQFFCRRLAERGVSLAVPDLAPDFTTMTITSQLAIVEPLLASEPAVLFGSSLGGYIATLAAARRPEQVRGLILLAPAFAFAARWEARIGPSTLARWRATGTAPVFHYGRGREEPLGIGLLDDARRYPDAPDSRCPTLVFAGRHDDAVPLDVIEQWTSGRPGCELVIFDDGHELMTSLESMWERTASFLRACAVLDA